MSRPMWSAVWILVVLAPCVALAQPSGDREHGRYLTQRVAMCVQCHTPRDRNGDLILSELFMGAPVPVSQPTWATSWAFKAPRIARMPGYTEADAVRLLTQGISRTGQPPMSPMPPFRMSEQDAKDIYAYLSTLPAGSSLADQAAVTPPAPPAPKH